MVNRKWFLILGVLGGLAVTLGMSRVASATMIGSGNLSVSAILLPSPDGSPYNPTRQ